MAHRAAGSRRARAARPLVLISGFGPFEAFGENPSGAVALELARRPPPGLRVRAAVLPVSFARAPRAWDILRAGAGRERPALYLGLGVQRRAGFRLEQRAGPRLKKVARADVDGRLPAEFSRARAPLACELPLAPLRRALRGRGVHDARVSRSAGGYVCEWIYHHLLVRGQEHGVPALFVHVPPVRFSSVRRQAQVVRWLLAELLAAGALTPRARSADSRPSRSAARPRRRARRP